MKKFKTVLLSVAVTAALVSNTFAQPLMLTYDGSVHKYTGNILKLKVNGALVETDTPPVIIDSRSLVPARAVFEKLGASVKWDGINKKVTVSMKNTDVVLAINNTNALVNNKTVKMDVPAKIINDRTMIPVRFVSEQFNAKVGWYPDDSLVTIDTQENSPVFASLNRIECASKGDNDQVTLYVDNYKDSNIFELNEPKRIVIDLPNTNLDLKQKPEIKGTQIKDVRYSQFEEDTARVVLDVVDNAEYKVEKQSGMLVLDVLGAGLTDRGDIVRDPTPKPTSVKTVKPTETPKPTSTHTATGTPGATPAPAATSNTGELSVQYSSENNKNSVSIICPNYKDYKIVMYTDPNRIVIDIPGAKIQGEQKLDVNSSLIKAVRYAMLNENTARVVLDVVGQPSYQTAEYEGQLVIDVEEPAYKNIVYHNDGDRVGFILPNVKLTEGDQNLKKLYTGSYDSTGYLYTITYPRSQGDIGSGTMSINDSILKTVQIVNDTSTGKISITFETREKFFYEVITRSSESNTAITLLKPAEKGEKLVVIDPGHGGSEPGAESFGTVEKDFNLDISIRLNKLLKAKGIRTYIIREDDSYIGLYERAYIANDLNASLFLCIHNNAYYSAENGTETLYFPNRSNSTGFTGKRFAEIVQSNLVSTLGTKNRGIVERPNLVVLKATTMPAALAEIAFMTNKSDFAKLQSESFRQQAAEALCNSVIQALAEAN